MSEGVFVFAVCGGREHLERAASAAALLRRATSRRIAVLTDPARNRGRLEHDDILTLATDPALSDAQAAIVLKTSVAETLPGGPHVYLDSDVLAVGDVERIFDDFVPPLTFAADLTTPLANLRTFSPWAVECGCLVERDRFARYFSRLEALTALHAERGELAELADPALYERPAFAGERRRGAWWNGTAEGGRADGAIRFRQRFVDGEPVSIRYSFAGSPWELEKDSTGERFLDSSGTFRRVVDAAAGSYWEDEQGDSLRVLPAESAEAPADGEERWWFEGGAPRLRWRADREREGGGSWIGRDGLELGSCDHLAERLEPLFAVAIGDRTWVPWNGGLFLFDSGSRPFLADWRSRCLRLFAEPGFRVRDQGALVAAVWAAGLASHPRLPPADNRLVDRGSRAARDLTLDGLRRDGVRFVHLIAGGLDDRSWPLGSELAALSAAAQL